MDDLLDVGLYLAALRRKWAWVALPTLLAAGLAAGYSLFKIPRLYMAETVVLIPQEGKEFSGLAALSGSLPIPLSGLGFGGQTRAINTYEVILKSRHIRQAVAEQFNLRNLYDADNDEETLRALEEATKIGADAKANMLSVRVSFSGTSQLPKQDRWGPNDVKARQLCADMANAYIEHLEKYTEENSVFQVQRNRAFIEQRKALAHDALQAAEAKLLAYQDEREIVSLPDEMKALVESHADLERQRTAAELEHHQASEQLDLLRKRLLAQAEAGLTESFPDARAMVEQHRSKLAELEVELAAKSESLAATNPEIRELTTKIEETQSRLREQLEKAYKSVEKGLVSRLVDLEVKVVSSEAKMTGLKGALSRSAAKLSEFPSELLSLGRLQREIEVQQQVYALLSSELERAKIEEAKGVMGFEVLDPAVPPERKSAPSVRKNVMMAALFMLLFSATLVCLRAGSRPLAASSDGAARDETL